MAFLGVEALATPPKHEVAAAVQASVRARLNTSGSTSIAAAVQSAARGKLGDTVLPRPAHEPQPSASNFLQSLGTPQPAELSRPPPIEIAPPTAEGDRATELLAEPKLPTQNFLASIGEPAAPKPIKESVPEIKKEEEGDSVGDLLALPSPPKNSSAINPFTRKGPGMGMGMGGMGRSTSSGLGPLGQKKKFF